MINAFALDDARLTRLENESGELNTAIWIDLLEPSMEERELLQNGLGQSLASFLELEDIEASARFFEDEDGLHLHSFFYCEDEDDYAILASVAFTVMDVCLPCVIASYPIFACIVCVRVINVYWNVTLMNCCWIYLKLKSNNWPM